MPFIPHTKNDVDEMLNTIGVNRLHDLFSEIPDHLPKANLANIPSQLNEAALSRLMRNRANQDNHFLCFIGAGAYEHHIPAAVWDVASRGEFLTAYTPYQAEASQGTLQLLYEYQTMMASLMSLAVSNASLYDGASSLAEAILMAIRSRKNNSTHRILLPKTIHPHYRHVVRTIVGQHGIELVEVDYCEQQGRITIDSLENVANSHLTALVIPQPNFFGVLEEVDELTDWIHQKGGLAIGVVNPLSMALLKPPGQWGHQGADIACGEGQPLGVPLASGGPYYGFLCCKQELTRQLPGRIVGRTVDAEGNVGFVLTLQAREQHIRRAKATSNICTNQGLLVTASTIHMSLLGPEGLARAAIASHQNTQLLREKLLAANIVPVFSSPFFHELVVRLPVPAELALKKLAQCHIQGGFSLKKAYPELGECLLICVTETKTADDIHYFVEQLTAATHLSTPSTASEVPHVKSYL